MAKTPATQTEQLPAMAVEDDEYVMPEEGLPDPAKMSKAQLAAYVAELREKLDLATSSIGNPWAAAKLPDGRYRVRIPPCTGNLPVRISGTPFIGEMDLREDQLQQVMEIFGRSIQVEMQRMQFRGNMAAPELVPTNDFMSKYTRPANVRL